MKTRFFLFALPALLICASAMAETSYQPFVLASVNETGLDQQSAITADALEAAGFEIAGQYSPLENTRVMVVTSDELKNLAAQSDRGGYGAGQRVSISERDGKTEVAFINPLYIQYAYRMDADLQSIHDQLSGALGNQQAFGANKKMTPKKLAKYHYKPMMPYFDDPLKLGSFDSHEAAIAAVEEGLAVEGDALSQVYRIDIPGKEQTVFGVGMKAASDDDEDIDEAHQLAIVDFEGFSKVAYFPYEIIVDGADVEALPMKFRMAVHFPDLPMMGSHSFIKLSSSPGATRDAFEKLVDSE
ncbi:MAG: hypothetical protein OES53_09720 [Xanthomonadales bacterium]|jgi:hypothetical protein|nr:hypothetical protein [Xanthomonadales bacterium]MDH3939407.1 hypothetical protein [Xanthomonadales bacterium]MDH4002373.1 hypothetical protein [Xanthomonadales bacterium]